MVNKRELIDLCKSHAATHPGMLGIVCRVVCYTIGVLVSLLVADNIFEDGYTATASVFILFSAMFELLWNTPATNSLENAVHEACMSCEPGGTPERIAKCYHRECPLNSVRPYQLVSGYRLRLFVYILCVLGIGAIGFCLAKQSDAVAHPKHELKK